MTLAALRREILVAAPPPRTFELFTGRIGSWWPLATYSVFGDGTVGYWKRSRKRSWTGIRGRTRRRPPMSW